LQRRILLIPTVLLIAGVALPQEQTREPVVRATLENGLRVVIVRDPLAPVVTIEENYLAGGNETPAGFPRNGPCAGTYGVSRMRGVERGSR
jgi:zinc protease